MTSRGTSTLHRVGPVRHSFRTPLPHSPLTPQASLQLLASLGLVALEGEAAPSPQQLWTPKLCHKRPTRPRPRRTPPLQPQRWHAAHRGVPLLHRLNVVFCVH